MFKTMTSVLDPKSKVTDDEIKKIPPFLFCRWLSGNPYTIGAANQINVLYNIPIENQYEMIKSVFAGNIKYIPYPKNESINNPIEVQYISDYFKISEEKAKEYLEFISDEELQTIVKMYEHQSGVF